MTTNISIKYYAALRDRTNGMPHIILTSGQKRVDLIAQYTEIEDTLLDELRLELEAEYAEGLSAGGKNITWHKACMRAIGQTDHKRCYYEIECEYKSLVMFLHEAMA